MKRRNKILLTAALVILFADVTVYSAGIAGLRWSPSESLPPGLYTTTEASDLIEFCLAQPYAKIALTRGYRSPGRCPDGGTPLVKPVVATAGDLVQVSPAGIRVNGHMLDNTAPREIDARGRRLDAFPAGDYIVRQGEVWVASSYSDRSFDSRYFGPVEAAAILDRVRPLVTWR